MLFSGNPHLFFPNCLLMYFISILNTNVSLIMRSRTSNACLIFFPSELRYYCHHYKDHDKCPTKVTTRIPLRQQRCYFVKIAAIRAYDWWVLSSALGIQRMSTAIEHVPRPFDINNYNTKTVEGGSVTASNTGVEATIFIGCKNHITTRQNSVVYSCVFVVWLLRKTKHSVQWNIMQWAKVIRPYSLSTAATNVAMPCR